MHKKNETIKVLTQNKIALSLEQEERIVMKLKNLTNHELEGHLFVTRGKDWFDISMFCQTRADYFQLISIYSEHEDVIYPVGYGNRMTETESLYGLTISEIIELIEELWDEDAIEVEYIGLKKIKYIK